MTTENQVPNLKFLDLTTIGKPVKEIGLSNGLDETIFSMPGGPDKLNFYYQTSSDTDKAAFIKTMNIYLKEKERLDKINTAKEDIRRILNKSWRKEKAQAVDNGLVFKQSKLTPPVGIVEKKSTNGGGLIDYVSRWNKQPEMHGGSGKLTEYMNIYDTVSKPGYIKSVSDYDEKYTKENLVEDYDADPIFSANTVKTNTSDRLVFVFGTYIIRAIILFMIEWSINSHMITTFQQCFNAYIVGYISLFLVWVLLANIGENKYEQNVLLNSLFYYINSKNKGAYARIGVHLIIQVLLLPFIFIIKYQTTPIEQDSFEQKRALYNAISNVTFLIWLMTTVIASRL